MKVFISHSWKNKTQAQKIADDLKAAGMEIWMDAKDLLPGKNIQKTIDGAIKNVDVVLLVWTKDAELSGGVFAEIYTCSNLKKLLIPCLIDGTSLDSHLYLKQIKGIHFQDFDSGLIRLKMALVNYMAEGLNLKGLKSINYMNDYLGTLEITNHLIYNHGIKANGSEKEKDFWVEQINKNSDIAYAKLKQQESDAKEISDFMAKKMPEIEKNLNNEQNLLKIINQFKKFKHAKNPVLLKLQGHVKGIYENLKAENQRNPIDIYRDEMIIKLEEAIPQIKKSLGIFSSFTFPAVYENLRFYFLESANILQSFVNLSNTNGIAPVTREVASFLVNYIKTPGGVVDNTQFGIFGYADDAYFIYGILNKLALGNIITLNVDWNKVNEGSVYAFNFLGSQVKDYLDNFINNYTNQLNAVYYPQAVQQQQYAQDQYIMQQRQRLSKERSDIFVAKMEGMMGGFY